MNLLVLCLPALLAVSCVGAAISTVSSPVPARVVALSEEPSFRVMTFNIQSASHGLEAVAQTIRSGQPDVVALQEVDCGTLRSRGVNQAEALALATGLPYFRHFRATELHGGPYGVALLSRTPFLFAEQHALPNESGLEPRTVARAVVNVGGRNISVYVTHLSHLLNRGALRERQAQRILSLVRADPFPVVLLGDFNESRAKAVSLLSSALVDAFARVGRGPSGTFPLPIFLPELRLDFVFASAALRPLQSFVLRHKASDHYPVVADMGFAEAAEVLQASATGTAP
jgi:endonuclease/exonuclease/phosphatase family metal-dependent hydrolase